MESAGINYSRTILLILEYSINGSRISLDNTVLGLGLTGREQLIEGISSFVDGHVLLDPDLRARLLFDSSDAEEIKHRGSSGKPRLPRGGVFLFHFLTRPFMHMRNAVND